MRLISALLLLLFPIGLVSSWQVLNGWPAQSTVAGAPADARARLQAMQTAAETLVDDRRPERWQRHATDALQTPIWLDQRYSERIDIDADTPFVAVFRIDLRSPRHLQLVSRRAPGARGGLVIDILDRSGQEAGLLASFGPQMLNRRWPVPVGGSYYIRVQSTIGARGGFGFAIAERRVLDFPVDTAASDAVRSFFGAERDGGAREHHGIDIFAPRDTAVLAAADGLISRVATSPRGGLHIWQRAMDETGAVLGSLYYAHLESVNVAPGAWVSRGERLGGVGNSGNAISTPPHLHFGWYQRFQGPVDPLPLTGSERARLAPPEVGHGLPRWLAVAAPALNQRAGPGTGFDIVGTLDDGDLVQVAGLSGQWARIIDDRGYSTYVASRLLGAPGATSRVLTAAAALLSEPLASAPQIVSLPAGERVGVQGRWGGFLWVQTATGRYGWLRDDGSEPSAHLSDPGSPVAGVCPVLQPYPRPARGSACISRV